MQPGVAVSWTRPAEVGRRLAARAYCATFTHNSVDNKHIIGDKYHSNSDDDCDGDDDDDCGDDDCGDTW